MAKGRGAKVPRVPWCRVKNNPKSLRFATWSTIFLVGCTASTPLEDPRVLRYNESAAITSLDPAAARSLEHMWVVDQLYDGLVELGPDLTVLPCLAKSWTFDEEKLAYRFRLRKEAVFTTGRPVQADDVVFSLERLRDPEVVSSGGWILDAVRPQGIVALNDTTVEVQLREAYPRFWVC